LKPPFGAAFYWVHLFGVIDLSHCVYTSLGLP